MTGRRTVSRLGATTLVASLLMVSCRHIEVARVEKNAPTYGAFAVAVSGLGRGLRLWQYSYLPGPDAYTCNQRAGPGTEVAVEITYCDGVDPESALAILTRAHRAITARLPELAGMSLRAHLVPPGQTFRISQTTRFGPDPPSLEFGVRWVEDVHSTRFAIRAIAHEAAHVARGLRGLKPSRDEEAIAGAFESCVEYAVFGSTGGFIYRGEFGTGAERAISKGVAASVNGFTDAYAAIQRFAPSSGKAVARSPGFERWCSSMVDATTFVAPTAQGAP